jgi:UDP-glucose 4-epimerase
MATILFGGAGFIGLNIAEQLVAQGREAVLFDRAEPPAAALAAFGTRVRCIVADVRDADAVARAVDRNIDTVVWGAAITADAARDAREPEAVLAVNLAALVPVLRAARAAGVRRVVNLSSASAYGRAGFRGPPLDETLTCADPDALYAITKFATERVADRLAELWSLDVRSVRLSGVFGPWEHATGARDTLSPLYQVMRLAQRGEEAILARPGERDWTYAPDVADGVMRVLDAPAPRHALYNIGTGARFTVLAWGERLAALRPGFRCRLARAGETPNVSLHGVQDRASMTAGRARDDLGFTARYGCEASAVALDRWARAHPWAYA